MNGLTRWDPIEDWDLVRELEEFQTRMGTAFRRSAPQNGNEMVAAEWVPMVDILEDEDEFLIKADLPEVKIEDVHVTVENNILSIRGERKFEPEERPKRYRRSER